MNVSHQSYQCLDTTLGSRVESTAVAAANEGVLEWIIRDTYSPISDGIRPVHGSRVAGTMSAAIRRCLEGGDP